MTSTTPTAKEATMHNQPTRPTTTCNGPRTEGYAFVAGLMTCRKCGLLAVEHESIDDVAARTATSEWAQS
jgi:hypothetical protein